MTGQCRQPFWLLRNVPLGQLGTGRTGGRGRQGGNIYINNSVLGDKTGLVQGAIFILKTN